MKIKTVAIIGAGAIGSHFIAGLTEKLGDDLWIVAEGERKERLEKNGIVINDQKYDLHVKTPEEAKGVDLLIISVKYGALQGTLPMIEKIVDAHTLVISPMNGVDSESDWREDRHGAYAAIFYEDCISQDRQSDRLRSRSDHGPLLWRGQRRTK